MPGPARGMGCRPPALRAGGFCLAALQHSVQVMRRILDVEMLVLSRAALGNEQAATVGFFEIPVGKLVMPLGILRLLVVHPQIPFGVFGKPMEANVFVFLLRGRLMLAPR